MECYVNCFGGVCDKNGWCVSCKLGYYGEMCIKVCGNCINCDRIIGC